jgi:hypothetical protein
VMNDRALKATALSYVVSKGYFPQLEVIVSPELATGVGRSKKSPALTDVDVLGLMPDEFSSFRKLLIDCKTLRNQSPISRAFWMRGLMDEMKAERGLCVLRGDRIEQDHRLSAARLQVLLLTEEEFSTYIRVTGIGLSHKILPCSSDLETWEKFFDLKNRFVELDSLIKFSVVDFWQFTSAADEVVSLIFTGYLLPQTQNELSEALLMVLYGGKGNYDTLNSLRRLLRVSTDTNREELKLPEWSRFIQTVRETLEAPNAMGQVPLLLRECSWAFLADRPLDYAGFLTSKSVHVGKFALLICEYLCEAAKLPPEFRRDLTSVLLNLQMVHL